jgi:hypothetical protein
MFSQADRVHLLDDAIARAVPGSRAWFRGQPPASSGFIGESDYRIEVQSPLRPATQRLVVYLRHDGDIQVEYHIADKRGTPFETLFVLSPGHEATAIEEVSRFVADLLAERLVLAYAKGILRGGRRFLRPGSLTKSDRRKLKWITSWLGTFDWLPSPD